VAALKPNAAVRMRGFKRVEREVVFMMMSYEGS
jgi:hypothetical protein